MLGDVVATDHGLVFETEVAAVCSLLHQLASALDFLASCQYIPTSIYPPHRHLLKQQQCR